MKWKSGDLVRLTFAGRTVDAIVDLTGGRSLLLTFEAIVGGYAGAMPVLLDLDGKNYREIRTEQIVIIEEGHSCD
jgi:hypothetical protein